MTRESDIDWVGAEYDVDVFDDDGNLLVVQATPESRSFATAQELAAWVDARPLRRMFRGPQRRLPGFYPGETT